MLRCDLFLPNKSNISGMFISTIRSFCECMIMNAIFFTTVKRWHFQSCFSACTSYFAVLRRRLPRVTLSIKLPCEGLGQYSEEPRSIEDKFSFNITFSCSFEELPFSCMCISSIQYYALHAVGKKYSEIKVWKKKRKCYTWFGMEECCIKISWTRWYDFWTDFTATTKQ